jgi:hypothetical protein
MDPTTLANLLAQLIPLGINIYSQIQQANANSLKPIEQVLAEADANWDAIAVAAAAQIAKDKEAIASQSPTL